MKFVIKSKESRTYLNCDTWVWTKEIDEATLFSSPADLFNGIERWSIGTKKHSLQWCFDYIAWVGTFKRVTVNMVTTSQVKELEL